MRVFTTCAICLLFAFNSMASNKVKASFKADKQTGPLPLEVSFTGMADHTGQSYKWDFGNGNTSSLKSTTAMFVNPGKYTVKLIVSNGAEIDSSFMSIDVLPNPDMINMYKKKPLATE